MKAARFEYQRAASVDHANELLSSGADQYVKVLGGGQSLNPMINLRLVQPDKLIDVSALAELTGHQQSAEFLTLGAATRHAWIEDGKVVDTTNGLLAYVAAGIAHRAVRNRGTIGGSLVHADPSADWVSTMRLLDPNLVLQSSAGRRSVAARDFFTGPFSTVLEDAEVLVLVEVPVFSPGARWSYKKFCRKPGEFAEALAAIWIDAPHGIYRAVIGALSTTPCLIEGKEAMAALLTEQGIAAVMDDIGLTDPIHRQWQKTMLQRAFSELGLSTAEDMQ